MNARMTDIETDLLSIGDVAEETGVSVDTIRVWERRYGRPEPVRLPSGHRRYTKEHVRWLRRVAEALALGHRPGRIVRLGEKDLDRLLGEAGPAPAASGSLERLLPLIEGFRQAELETALLDEAERRGLRGFLAGCVGPLLVAVGRQWADGGLEIRHEHFLSGVLEDLLRTLRLRLETPQDGPTVLLATLSGESHALGLHMAALTASLAGMCPCILGTDSPNEEIVAAAGDCGATAVAISISLATGGVRTDRVLADLRASLPDDVTLVVGGRGARGVRRGPRGIVYVKDLEELEDALAALV
jgi:methylmalonyl-CoA mutase cobalamin-binding subunit